MLRKPFTSRALLVVLAVAGSVVGAAAGAHPPLATVQGESALLRWVPTVESAGATLVLADPTGAVQSFRFQSGEIPAISLFDAQGAALPDGTYTWELRLMPAMGIDQRRDAGPRTMSGYFTLAGGSLLDPDLLESPETQPRRVAAPGLAVAADQVVPDDLIVDGKACIGLGCGNNESFLNETLRLKQSVVKLRFEDTSTGAFAGSDWQLSANEVGSGAANRFFLEDLTAGTTPLSIFAGAPSNSLYVTTQGRVGLGTATPGQGFHLVGATTPTLRLEQTGGTPRTWDLSADAVSFRLVDVTNASTVPVRIAAGAPADRLVVTAGGSVGVGANPTAPFSVLGNAPTDAVIRVRNLASPGYSGIEFIDEDGTPGFFFGVNNSNSTTRLNSFNFFPFLMMTQSTERIRIESDGDIAFGCTDPGSRFVIGAGGSASCATAPWSSINPGQPNFNTSSSRAYKENLDPIKLPNILDTIAKVGVYHYDFIDGPKDRIGLVAEDFHQIFGRGSDKVIQGGEVEMALWLAVQGLIEQNRELAARNDELTANHTALASRLAALEGSTGRAHQ